MDDHPRILQQRVQPAAIAGDLPSHRCEGALQQHQDEHAELDQRNPHHRLAFVVARAPDEEQADGARQNRPEQERPLLPGPERREQIPEAEVVGRVPDNILVGVVVPEDRPPQHGRRHSKYHALDVPADPCAPGQRTGAKRHDIQDQRTTAENGRDPQGDLPHSQINQLP